MIKIKQRRMWFEQPFSLQRAIYLIIVAFCSMYATMIQNFVEFNVSAWTIQILPHVSSSSKNIDRLQSYYFTKQRSHTCRRTLSQLYTNAAYDVEGQISQGLQRAKEVLQKSKEKLEAIQEKEIGNDDNQSDIPFFANTIKTIVARDGVVKSINEETGLVTADGERMAAISELEDWEFRSLFEVFENEMTEDEDRYSLASQQLASRDVAASVFNLRKELQTDDYQTIFDVNNRFIGEDN